MNEEAQLLEVVMEGYRFVFEITKENIEIMKKAVLLFQSALNTMTKPVKKAAKLPEMLTYSKSSGKTNRKNFNLKAGAGIMFKLEEKHIKDFEKIAKKTGVLYVKMGRFNKESDKIHLLIPAQSSGIVADIMNTILENEVNRIKKQVKKEVYKSDIPDEEKKEKYEEILNEKLKNLESRNHIESVNEYAREEGFDNLSMDEFNQKLSQIYPGASAGFNNSPQMSEEITENVREIKEAIKKNIYDGRVNNPEMVYVELPVDSITGQSQRDITLISADKKSEISIPRESVFRLNSDNIVAVLHKKSLIDVKDDKGIVKSLKTMDVKEIMHPPRYEYSRDFSNLFFIRDYDKNKYIRNNQRGW